VGLGNRCTAREGAFAHEAGVDALACDGEEGLSEFGDVQDRNGGLPGTIFLQEIG